MAVIVICSSCEELPPNVQKPLAAVLPTPTPAGWWNDEGASGSPKIVVHLSEQKAYFYKGRHLVGETTVSTGKPGFSTPPGHYHVTSKDKNHVSSEFGDYVDDEGNVVKSNIDVRKDTNRAALISTERGCRIACILTVAMRCTRVMSHLMRRPTAASDCLKEWLRIFFTPPPKALDDREGITGGVSQPLQMELTLLPGGALGGSSAPPGDSN